MAKKSKEAKKKPKKQRTGKKHQSVQPYKYFEIKDSKVEKKRKPCPRCGTGTNLSEHKNREYCGKCGYTVVNKIKKQ